jgi:hypothetical protein
MIRRFEGAFVWMSFIQRSEPTHKFNPVVQIYLNRRESRAGQPMGTPPPSYGTRRVSTGIELSRLIVVEATATVEAIAVSGAPLTQ